MKLTIDPELCAYLGGVSKFTAAELERQLIESGGPREPIYVWKGHGVILDGHRRYKVCCKHNLPYRTVEIDLPDKEAVRDWIDRHQFCRRNVPPAMEVKHIARLVAQNGSIKHTAEAVGKSTRQVIRDVQYANDLEQVVPDVRERLESGEMSLAKKALHSLATLTPEQQRDVVSQVDKGEFRTLKDALLGEKQKTDDSDIVSPSPPKKPREDYFKEAVRALGQFKKLLGDMNTAFPDDQYKAAVAAANAINKALQTWKGNL